MRYANWIIATAAGASLCLLSGGSMAQLKTGAKEDVDSPRGKVLGVSGDTDVPKTKGLAAERDAANTRLTERREAADEQQSEIDQRRETRRLPVIDANAGSTFRSTQLIGAIITDDEGRPIGKIVDFVVDSRGNISYQIVSYFGTPGFTGKLFAIPFSGLRLSAGEKGRTMAQFAFDPALLQNAPSFSSTRFPDFSDQVFLGELQTFFASVLSDTRILDPTLPANGPGDRPATVNPALPRLGTEPAVAAPSSRIPGTTGTENAGFPATAGAATRTGTSGSAAAGANLSGSIGSSRTGATTKSGTSVVGRTSAPAGSTRPGGTVVGGSGTTGRVAGGVGGFVNPALLVQTSQGVMHKDAAARLGLEGTPLPTNGAVGGRTGSVAGGVGGFVNPDLLVMTSQGVMHRDAAARLGLEGTPIPTTKTAPGGSRTTPGGTRTPDFRPSPAGGPMPRAGGAGPRIPAPGAKVPGIPGVPAVPAGPAVPGGHGVPATPASPATPAGPAAPSAPGPAAPGGAGSGGGASTSGK